MRLVGRSHLDALASEHPEVGEHLNAWEREVEKAQWRTPHDLKQRYPRASLLGDQQVIFDIMGNNYRIDTKISYKNQVVIVAWAGTHAEYNRRFGIK